MATSSVTNSTSNAGAAAIAAMGGGSGMDVKALAQAIVDSQKMPQSDAINKKIDQSNAKISGYSAVRYVLDQLKSAFLDLNTTTDFNALNLSNSQTAAYSATATSAATAGSHTIAVTQLASPQRNASPELDLSLTTYGTSLDLTVGDADPVTITSDGTPAGIAAAINAKTADTGVSAQLVKVSATGYKMVVSGSSGTSNAFSLTGSGTGDELNLTPTVANGQLQEAQDALLTVDGLSLTRSSNRIDDIITGVTLDLNGATTGTANLNLALDTTPVATKLTALVDAYNMVQTVLTDAYNKDSKTADYGASLVGDSTVQTIRAEVRAMFTSGSSLLVNDADYVASGKMTALRDLGITLDAKGVMSLDKAKLSTSLQADFTGAVKMLTNNVNNSFISSTEANGVANDAINKLTRLLSSDGLLVVQSNNAAKRVTDFETQLSQLNDRMTKLLERYNKQFAAMESIVGQSKSLQTSLKSTFDNMNNSSNN
jgi:flagellar hook-associated protein 2